MKILVTGCAGFIGMHVAQRLLERGDEIVGVDNLNAYYDPSRKETRLPQLQPHPRFSRHRLDMDRTSVYAEYTIRVDQRAAF
ncbi:MAG TPA: GDP-mannose 4,6-dehydratase [Burkholderiales bacterium]|nr:GDP-mannose 4,6-dehydratase [Burkholderiales bacterium]